jgi:hypothetical protein
MYKKIRARPSSVKLYGDQLVASGVMTEEWRAGLNAKLNEHLEKEWAAAHNDYSKVFPWAVACNHRGSLNCSLPVSAASCLGFPCYPCRRSHPCTPCLQPFNLQEGGSMWVKGCRPSVSEGHPALYDGTAFAGAWSGMRQASVADMARNDPTGTARYILTVYTVFSLASTDRLHPTTESAFHATRVLLNRG